jgi:hypothetical protein
MTDKEDSPPLLGTSGASGELPNATAFAISPAEREIVARGGSAAFCSSDWERAEARLHAAKTRSRDTPTFVNLGSEKNE